MALGEASSDDTVFISARLGENHFIVEAIQSVASDMARGTNMICCVCGTKFYLCRMSQEALCVSGCCLLPTRPRQKSFYLPDKGQTFLKPGSRTCCSLGPPDAIQLSPLSSSHSSGFFWILQRARSLGLTSTQAPSRTSWM